MSVLKGPLPPGGPPSSDVVIPEDFARLNNAVMGMRKGSPMAKLVMEEQVKKNIRVPNL